MLIQDLFSVTLLCEFMMFKFSGKGAGGVAVPLTTPPFPQIRAYVGCHVFRFILHVRIWYAKYKTRTCISDWYRYFYFMPPPFLFPPNNWAKEKLRSLYLMILTLKIFGSLCNRTQVKFEVSGVFCLFDFHRSLECFIYMYYLDAYSF